MIGQKINNNNASVSKIKKVEISQLFELIISKRDLLLCLAQNKFRIHFFPLRDQISACFSEAKTLIEEDEIPLVLLQLIRNSMNSFQTLNEIPKTQQGDGSNLVSILLTITNGNQKKFVCHINEN